MPYVADGPNFTNTAETIYYGKSDSGVNCALCTAAGAVNLDTGSVVCQTKDVADYFSKSDNKYALGGSLKGQVSKIDKFVRKMLKCKSTRYVSNHGRHGKSVLDAKSWMMKFPEETVFAVNVNGMTNGGVNVCHWLNAKKTRGTIRYFDYQVCRDASKFDHWTSTYKPASSVYPIAAAQTQSSETTGMIDLHRTNQKGTMRSAQHLCLIAFHDFK